MLTFIYIVLELCFVGVIATFASKNRKNIIICKLRDNRIIPEWFTSKVVAFWESEFSARLQKEENLSITTNMMLGITFFWIAGELVGRILNWNITVVLMILQLTIFIWIINMYVSDEMRRFYFGVVLLCIVCMLLSVWSEYVILMVRFLLEENKDMAIGIIDICIFILVRTSHNFCHKWCSNIYNAKRYFRYFGWGIFVLMLFSFGVFNLIYFNQAETQEELIAILKSDSSLLYFGRMIYAGITLLICGSGYITRQITQTNYADLSIIYNLGVGFSYNEFVIFHELIMVSGYLFIVFGSKFFSKVMEKMFGMV